MYPNTTLGMKTAKFYQQEKEALARQNLLAQTCQSEPIAPDHRVDRPHVHLASRRA